MKERSYDQLEHEALLKCTKPLFLFLLCRQCSKPCGGGIKTRLVVCQRPSGERFSDQSCEILDKPPDREQCNKQPCSHWRADPWSSVRP